MPHRVLRIERMEERVALAVDWGIPLTEIDLTAFLKNPVDESFSNLEAKALDAASDLANSLMPQTPLSDTGEVPIHQNADQTGSYAKLRVELRDTVSGEELNAVKPGETYMSKVFVQDVRKIVSDDELVGGVFQAFVDIQASPNARFLFEPTFSDAFGARRQLGTEEPGSLLGVGAAATNSGLRGQSEQFLFQVPVQFGESDSPSFIEVVPSVTRSDSVLLFNQNSAVPEGLIENGATQLASISSVASTNEPAPDFIDTLSVLNTQRPVFMAPQSNVPYLELGQRTAPFQSKGLQLVSRDVTMFLWPQTGNFNRAEDLERKLKNEKLFELELPADGLDVDSRAGHSESDAENNRNDSEIEKSGSNSHGLFFDELIFLEGTVINPLKSELRLHFRVIEYKSPLTDDDEIFANPVVQNHKHDDGFVDIARILNRPTEAFDATVDRSIVEFVEAESIPSIKLVPAILFDSIPDSRDLDDRSGPPTGPVDDRKTSTGVLADTNNPRNSTN